MCAERKHSMLLNLSPVSSVLQVSGCETCEVTIVVPHISLDLTPHELYSIQYRV